VESNVPDPIGELASVLFAELRRQCPRSIDLSDNQDLTLVATFDDALDLRQLAAAIVESSK
jgi:hypothetical protein